MVGANAVELDIVKEYPKLHPVFNFSLIVRYVGKNSKVDRGKNEGIKDKYYRDDEIVNWKLMNAGSDAPLIRKGKYQFLVSWKDATVANDTWIAEENFPEGMKGYLAKFRETHQELLAAKKKNMKIKRK